MMFMIDMLLLCLGGILPNIFIRSHDCINSLTEGTSSINLTRSEQSFLEQNEVCRVATSHNDIPHVTTVNYCYIDHFIFFATDYNTRKYKNLEQNRNIGIIIDSYSSSVNNKAVIIQGMVEFIERGNEFVKLYKLFDSRFNWVRNDPWKEGEAPFVKIIPRFKASWGLN
jgi:uncharacterized protein